LCVCDSLFCKIHMSLRVILQVTSTYNFPLFKFCTFQKICLWKHNRVCSYTMMEHLLVTMKLYLGLYFPGVWVSCGGPHLGHPYLWNTGSCSNCQIWCTTRKQELKLYCCVCRVLI